MALFEVTFVGKPAPAIAAGDWFNISSFPSLLAQELHAGRSLVPGRDLAGKPAAIFFWDYECGDCLDALPVLNTWWKRFHAAGLMVIGVHTPQFEFAKDADKVESAILRSSISYPVVNDADYISWNTYNCKAWPRLLLLDAAGIVRYDIHGVIRSQEIEPLLKQLLKVA